MDVVVITHHSQHLIKFRHVINHYSITRNFFLVEIIITTTTNNKLSQHNKSKQHLPFFTK
ncbi:hypothetical protein Hanom_Chr05g00463541 [Helianthus anomalus]